MSQPFIPLGPFQLSRRIGRGGMAEVWSGVHAAQGVPVAVKVMTGVRAREAQYRAAFRNEVQSVARLDHHGIVLVLDHGEISGGAEEASRGLLPAGSPYLAMELADGGTLAEVLAEGLSWAVLRAILCELLDALAHAHARGVVHRDLKPSNVLVFGSGNRRSLKLADFGLAQAVEMLTARPDSTEFICGTPSFMAPEQIRGEWRDYGAWTDLYGLGCLAWTLAAGRPPFSEVGLLELVRRQLEEEPPAFEPCFALPRGFAGWLRRLLEKQPGRRFVRAADAAWSLRQLGEPDPARSGTEPAARRAAPPLPARWESEAPRPSMQLVGAGLGLYGLRTIPLVGRQRERDILWSALEAVHGGVGPRLVLLRGAAGNGKTRLAEWLTERAHELGGATVLRASHGPSPGAADGLARMMARHLRCVGLSRAEVLARSETMLRQWQATDEEEWIGLTDLMAPGTAADGADVPRPRQQTARERFALIERHLRRLGRQRPVVLLLDDVPWGPESIALARFLLESRGPQPLPVLLLLTARDEVLAERPAEAAALAQILELPGAAALDVPPLPPEDRSALVRVLLGLSGDLAAQVDARTGGNPLFAVQLVGDWVQRGLLRVGAGGFELRPGALPHLPDDLHGVWSERVARLLETHPAGSREALEIAAALGFTVDGAEWEAACAAAGLPCRQQLAESLVANRLAVRRQEGWDFVHAMLRESLERMAREAGRWPAHNRACAAMLAPRAAAGERGIAERLGRHLLLAGDHAAALEPLLAGARERRGTSDYVLAHSLLTQREAALTELGAAPRDPRWGDGWALRARIHLHQGRLDDVFRWAGRAVLGGKEGAWLPIRSEALRLLGDAARRRGDLREAVRLYERCTATTGDRHGAAASLWGLGDVARQRGELALAGELFERSRALYEEIGDAHGIADHWIGLADLARQRLDLEAADHLYAEAEARFTQLGNRYGMARGRNGLGDVARLRGDLGRAAALYRGALELLTRLDSSDEIFPRVNLAFVALAGGDFPTAASDLEPLRETLAGMGWGALHACVRAALLPCAAQARDWRAWDQGFEAVAAVVHETGLREPDLAWSARLAGEIAAAAGEEGRAAAARELARGQA